MTIILSILFLLISIDSYEWEVVSNSGPPPRYINQMAYAEDKLIIFGGKNNQNKGFNDLWEWKNGSWNFLGEGEIKRWDHSFVYMENHDQLFVFGGRTFKEIAGEEERVDLNDSWVYRNNQWQRLTIESPDARSSHSMAFFPYNNQVILFGGRNKDETLGDTWSFDGDVWSRLEIEGPARRYGHSLTYDPISKTIYLFGGFDGENLLNDLWAFKGEEWVEVKTDISPSPRMAHAMKFDNEGRAILFGGWDDSNKVSGELWIWSNGKWEIANPERMPQGRLSCSVGYDKIEKRIHIIWWKYWF